MKDTYDADRERFDSDAVEPALVRCWSAEPGSVARVGDGANVVFRFTSGGGECFLKLFDTRHTPHALVESAADYLCHLADADVPVCRPIASISGTLVEMPKDLPEFAATVVRRVPGEPMGLAHRDLSVYSASGRTLGALHNAAARYRPGETRYFTTAESIWENVAERLPDDPVVRAEFEQVDDWRSALPLDERVMGLTHADYRPGNLFWDGETIWAIDFDEPVYDWWAADVARALLEFSEQRIEGRNEFLDAFLAGYREVRDFEDAWVEDIPWFRRLKDLDRYTWVLRCWSGERKPGGEPRNAFLARMREAFANPQPW